MSPCLDRVMDVTRFDIGTVIRANSARVFAAGKGVNAAFAVAALDSASHLYCLVGREDLEVFSNLHPLITSHIVAAGVGATRSNLTITEGQRTLICHLQSPSNAVDEGVAESVAEQFTGEMMPGDVAVVSGRIPDGLQSSLLDKTLRSASEKGAIVIVDVDPIYWAQIDWNRVNWTKPNLEELSRYCGRSLESEREIVGAVLESRLASRTVVSLGARGALLVRRGSGGCLLGQTRTTFTPVIPPIGCGDSMVGGFAVALSRGSCDEEVLSYGLGAGCANLAGEAPGRLDRSFFDKAIRDSLMTSITI